MGLSAPCRVLVLQHWYSNQGSELFWNKARSGISVGYPRNGITDTSFRNQEGRGQSWTRRYSWGRVSWRHHVWVRKGWDLPPDLKAVEINPPSRRVTVPPWKPGILPRYCPGPPHMANTSTNQLTSFLLSFSLPFPDFPLFPFHLPSFLSTSLKLTFVFNTNPVLSTDINPLTSLWTRPTPNKTSPQILCQTSICWAE